MELKKSVLIIENGKYPSVISWHNVPYWQGPLFDVIRNLDRYENSALELGCEHLQSQHWIFHPVTLKSIPTPALPQDQA